MGRALVKSVWTQRHKALVTLLVQHRRQAGLTQTEVARKLGEHQSFIARVESGQRRIDLVEFLTLAEIIGFDPVEAVRAVSLTAASRR